MKKFLLLTVSAACAMFFSACATCVHYKGAKTEETFRLIKNTNPQDLGIKSVVYNYKITGSKEFDAMSVSMKRGDLLRVVYSKGSKQQYTYIMNRDKACRINAANKEAEMLAADAAGTLKFFYDINFKAPAEIAKSITLRDQQTAGKEQKKYYIFDIDPKDEYGLKKIVLKVNAETRYIETADFQYPEKDPEIVIRNTYSDITAKNDLTAAQTIKSCFLGEKVTYRLTDLTINRSVKSDDFIIPEIKAPAVKEQSDKKTK